MDWCLEGLGTNGLVSRGTRNRRVSPSVCEIQWPLLLNPDLAFVVSRVFFGHSNVCRQAIPWAWRERQHGG